MDASSYTVGKLIGLSIDTRTGLWFTDTVCSLVNISSVPCASVYLTTTLILLPISFSVNVYVLLVAPDISTPDASHWYENCPRPSISTNDLVSAVKVWYCEVIPKIVRVPLGSSFTFATTLVWRLFTDSGAPCASVYLIVTPTVLPTSDWVNLYVILVAPEISTPDISHWYENAPKPSTSTNNVVSAVKILSCSTIPVIVTIPLGLWFTCVT